MKASPALARPRARWPQLWSLMAAVAVSLLLWAGLFYVIDAAGDLISSLRPAR